MVDGVDGSVLVMVFVVMSKWWCRGCCGVDMGGVVCGVVVLTWVVLMVVLWCCYGWY